MMNWKDIDQKQVITILLCTIGTFLLSIIRVQVDANTSAIGAVNAYASLQDAGIIRSRGKIEAAIGNAKIVLDLKREFGSFCNYLWSFSGGKVVLSPDGQPRATSPLSDRIAADMKKRGMRYAGSVTIHSFLQAAGIVNEHEESCYRYGELMQAGGEVQTICE